MAVEICLWLSSGSRTIDWNQCHSLLLLAALDASVHFGQTELADPLFTHNRGSSSKNKTIIVF